MCITHLPPSPLSSGDTLLAIRAPIGTQLEVPVPEAVSYVYGVCFGLYLIQLLLFHVSDHLFVLYRSSMDRGNTRSVSRAHLVPLRFYWSTRTHPVPPLLFCPSLPQMMSFKASRHQQQHLPHSSPLLPPRSIMISAPRPTLIILTVGLCHNWNNSNSSFFIQC